MTHFEFSKSESCKLKNPQKAFTDQQESQKKKLMALFELRSQRLNFQVKDMTVWLCRRLRQSTGSQNVLPGLSSTRSEVDLAGSCHALNSVCAS